MNQATLDRYCNDHRQARQADRICFTGRHPFTTDAYERGFAVGFRQHTSGFQDDAYPNADVPILFLDNDFRDPDLNEFLELVERYEPEVAVIGDATTRDDATQYQQVADELTASYSDVEPIIVPKCGNAFDELDQDTVLGWPNGYANVDPLDYSSIEQWRGRPVHVLGGMPDSQRAVIDHLTQPTLDRQPPADIVGVDGNGCFKAALFGEYWTPEGYEEADHLSIRETVRRSLEEIKQYWQDAGVWPEVEPIDRYGPAVLEPDNPIYMDDGGDPIRTRDDLESAYVEQYDDMVAFRSGQAKKFIEYRDGLI